MTAALRKRLLVGTDSSALNRLATRSATHSISGTQHLDIGRGSANEGTVLVSSGRILERAGRNGRHVRWQISRTRTVGAGGGANRSWYTHDGKGKLVRFTALLGRTIMGCSGVSFGLLKQGEIRHQMELLHVCFGADQQSRGKEKETHGCLEE